jgi:alpha-L-rhamnosidase
MNLKSVLIILLFTTLTAGAQQSINNAWKAQWISTAAPQHKPNTWLAYRTQITIAHPPKYAIAKIAVDSKYWLWVNGKMVVFEGGLKRGPNPTDSYYDTVDIGPYLKAGKNTIAVMVWYFGINGFSHKSSGTAGLLFDCESPGLSIISDESWKCTVLAAYQSALKPTPNYRLSESNILFDARLALNGWQNPGYDDSKMPSAEVCGTAGAAPWGNLVIRPIPLWKNYGLKNYISQRVSSSAIADTIICQLPYDAQVTPYLKLDADAGRHITICTDNYLFFNGGDDNIRGEYITSGGLQEYESLGWLNGDKVYYIIPKGVKVIDLKYRETGYNTELAGSFTSSDNFLNTLWKKAQRTLYINMRDNFMDCPDRERAQWTGDATIESGDSFYALSPSAGLLSKKWLNELVGWQRADSSMFAPVPSGSWTSELPAQVAASVGYYGLWNYYLNTGDKQTIAALYGGVKRYLDSWKKDDKGTVALRRGGWPWGDWGDNIDMEPLEDAWYYMAIKGLHNMAVVLNKPDDAAKYAAFMKTFKTSFNQQFWDGTAYRDPGYHGKTDDRTQALAVVSGLADKDKYPALLSIFKTEEHASPYMEKYVLEAMFIMGDESEGLTRFKKRFATMVNYPGFTTLFEGWGIGKDGFGGGTVNHAWSGGGLEILSEYLCGIAPVEAGYKTFQIIPQPGPVTSASAQVSSVAGIIKSSFVNSPGSFTLSAIVPAKTTAIIGLANKGYNVIKLNGKIIWHNGKYVKDINAALFDDGDAGYIKFKVGGGKWIFKWVR